MALTLLFPLQPCSFKHFSPRLGVPVRLLCNVHAAQHVQFLPLAQIQHKVVPRRSANYQPSIWDNEFVQSLKTDYTEEKYVRRAENLKQEVRRKLVEAVEPLARLELIDTLQRLGVGYHFQNEIKNKLNTIMSIKDHNVMGKEELHATALCFRILRQHGYQVPQDVFKNFKDEIGGGFKACICNDIKGMLSLYEASYYALEGEHILDEAQEFTIRHLKNVEGNIIPSLAKQVSHALEVPLHWRMQRIEARWFIDFYKMKEDMDPLLLEFAKLDFNMVQATHQQDLKDVSRWWTDLGLGRTLNFARDRLVENFFWSVGFFFEPQFGYCRRQLTKVNSFITIIDDVYDVYGSLDELELFTDAVERWDTSMVENLPDYMKHCFLALYNTTNQIAYDMLKEKGWDVIKRLKNAWTDILKSFLVEAKWYHSGYKPTLEEYLNNGWVSVTGPVILVHAYLFLKEKTTSEAFEHLENDPSLVQWASMVFRLANDLGTSTDELKRGDVSTSIQCYMNEDGASEEIARRHIRHLIVNSWKKMNKDITAHSPYPKAFINGAVNVARTAQCMYQYGDGHGVQDRKTKNRVLSLLVEPIPLVE